MLLFTPYCVYWLAVHPEVTECKTFFRAYAKATSFQDTARARRSCQSFNVIPQGGFSANFPFWGDSEIYWLLRHGEDIDDIIRHIPASHRPRFEAQRDLIKCMRFDSMIRTFRADMMAETYRIYGAENHLSILAAHAESILSMAKDELTDIETIRGFSVSLPEFILGNVLADGFGDDREDLVEAIMHPRKDDCIRRVAKEHLGMQDDECAKLNLARAVVEANVVITTLPSESKG